MSTTLPDDILLPTRPNSADNRPARSRVAAFVPIALALVGVAAILVGKVTVHAVARTDLLGGADPLVTGTVAAPPPQQGPVR